MQNWTIEKQSYRDERLVATSLPYLYSEATAKRRAATLTSTFAPKTAYVARPATAGECSTFQIDPRYTE